MSSYRRVVWHEGMLLTPHHFQQWDNYQEAVLQGRLDALQAYGRGVSDLRCNQNAIANGLVEVTHCRATLPDGLLFDAPDTDPLPAPRHVGTHFRPQDQRLRVYLAVPVKQPNGNNFQPYGKAVNSLHRYGQDTRQVVDETTGENEQPVALAWSNARLLFADEIRDGYNALSLAEIERTPTGQLRFAEQYLPPLLNVRAAPWLQTLLRQQVEMLITKSDTLGERRRQRSASLADFNMSDTAVFWLLNIVNAAVPLLAHLSRTPLVHPERLYTTLAELVGRLMTFSPDRFPKDIVPYDHDNLYLTFSKLDLELRALLETVIPTRCVPIPLEKLRESIYVGRVEDARLLREAEFYLGVQAQMPDGLIIRSVPGLVKIASRDAIDQVINNAVPGVALRYASPPPDPIPTRPRYHYFKLETAGVLWERIAGSQVLAVHIPEEVLNANVEMYAVKP